jgi:hypothetical protein
MIIKKFYRLSEYKIIEDENDTLGWESHTGLGGLKRGRCFVKGDILFIGASKIEEPGFLKNEFLEKLKPLPEWRKTGYYCLGNDVRMTKSGRRLKEKEMQAWGKGGFAREDKTDLPAAPLKMRYHPEWSAGAEGTSYKLGNYEIVVKTDGQLWWKAHTGYNRYKIGACCVAEDILFIGIKEHEESGGPKKAFLDYLTRLPEWSATRHYCSNCTLHDCTTGITLTQEEKSDRPKKGVKKSISEAFIHDKKDRKVRTGKPDLTKWIDIIHRHRIKTWIAYAAAFFTVIAALVAAVIIGFWNNEKDHHREGKHTTSHHRRH